MGNINLLTYVYIYNYIYIQLLHLFSTSVATFTPTHQDGNFEILCLVYVDQISLSVSWLEVVSVCQG